MNEGMEDRDLIERLGRLPRSISPANDPWQQIEARIRQPAQAGPLRRGAAPLALAAGIALALLVGLLMLQPDAPVAEQPAVAQDSGEAGPDQAAPRYVSPVVIELRAGELSYQAAFREYLDLGAGGSTGSISRDRRLAEGWTEMQAAETELLTALASYPDHPLLQARLNGLRQHQLDYLKNLVAIDTGSWSTT